MILITPVFGSLVLNLHVTENFSKYFLSRLLEHALTEVGCRISFLFSVFCYQLVTNVAATSLNIFHPNIAHFAETYCVGFY